MKKLQASETQRDRFNAIYFVYYAVFISLPVVALQMIAASPDRVSVPSAFRSMAITNVHQKTL